MEEELNPDVFDEPMEESDDSDGGLEDVPPRFHVLHNRIDERHHAADFVGSCRVKCNATRAGVRAAIAGCETLLEARSRNLKASVQQYIEEQELQALPASVRLLETFDVKSPFSGFKSNEGQINAIKSYYDYIPPRSCFLGVRMQHINIGEFQYRQRPVRETFQYVSLKDILKMVARKQSVLEYVDNQRPSDDGMLRSFTDGDAYANHPYFQTYPNAFQLGLFYDDIETTSPIGSKKGIHTMAFFAVKVLNVPQYINSVLGGYHVVALAHKTDIDKYGFRPILQNFIDDCRELESEQGVVTYIGDERVVQRACLCAVLGDSKAVHEILGFLLPGARHFCRLCMISRPQLHAGVVVAAPRTKDLHNQHVLQNVNDPDNSINNGVKEDSCLHHLRYFHSSNNYCLDSMHDISEGCGAMEMKLVLRHFACVRGYFMPFLLNRRINGYNYGFADRLNPPSGFFNIEGLRAAFTNHRIVGTSAQLFCLLRVLPLLLDNLGEMPDNDPHLRLLLLLQKIVQIVRAPVVPRTMMPYLQDLIADHRRLFSELFPGLHPINKHHHLEHYVQCMLKMGPLEQYNCMRGEASMRPMKRHIVAAGSYRDVCKTGVEYAQIYQAMMWSTGYPTVVPKFELVSAKKAVHVHECHTAALLNDPGGFRDDDIVHKVTTVSVYGRLYTVNSYVVIRKRTENPNDLEAFGKIVGIVVANNDEDVWFEVEECETVYLHPRFNAMVIRMPRRPIIHLYDPLDLPQHPPLSALHDFSTDNEYLVLRHVIV